MTATAQARSPHPEATPHRVIPIDPEKQRKGRLLEDLARVRYTGNILGGGDSFLFNNVEIINGSNRNIIGINPSELSHLLDLCQTNSLPARFRIEFVDSLPNNSAAQVAPGIGGGSVTINLSEYESNISRTLSRNYDVTPGTEVAAARALASLWINIRIVDGACATVYMTEMAAKTPAGELAPSQKNQALMRSDTFSASLERPLLEQRYPLGIVYGTAPITAPTPTN